MVTFHASLPQAWSRSAVNTSASQFNINSLNKLFLRDGWVHAFIQVLHSASGSGDIPPGQTMLVGTVPAGFRPQWRHWGVACDTARTSPCYMEPDGRIQLYNSSRTPFQKDIPIQLVFPPYPAAN